MSKVIRQTSCPAPSRFAQGRLRALGISFALAMVAAGPSTSPPATVEAASSVLGGEPLDYTTLSHVINIDTLRAGNHNEKGINDYYFSTTMYGLINSSEERNLEFDKRKKITVELGTFGDTKIEALAIWRPDEKAKDYKELKVDGNSIRELAARTMGEFKVQESQIAVQVDVAMYERAKKFVFFGSDLLVAKATYFPIPQTKFDTPLRTNQSLTIADDKGTSVKLSVRYDKPATAAKAKAPADAPPRP